MLKSSKMDNIITMTPTIFHHQVLNIRKHYSCYRNYFLVEKQASFLFSWQIYQKQVRRKKGLVSLVVAARLAVRENIFIMQNNQYLPNITSQRERPESNFFLRRRNLSISTDHQPETFNERNGHAQERCDFVYASRKNQLLIKRARFKGKDLTRLCQNNLAEYLSLKNQVTDLHATSTPTGQKKGMTQRDKNSKFSAKLFSFPGSFSTGKTEHAQKYRPRTENEPHQNAEDSFAKKYSQMSLQEIVESGDSFRLHTRIKDFQAKIRENLKRSRKESQEYQIDGW